jgi:hypothetical protein
MRMRHDVIGDRFVPAHQIVSDVIALAETATAGIQYVRVPSEAGDATNLVCGLAGQLRRLGFVTLGAGISLPPTLRDHLCHRHLAVHFRGGTERVPVVRWIRSLARASPRVHLLMEIETADSPTTPFLKRVPPAPEWTERVTTSVRRVQRWIDAARLEQAEALLASLDAEAAVRRARLPDCVSRAWARLRNQQGRTEEAGRRLNAVPGAGHFRELIDASAARHPRLAATGSRR